MKIVTAAVVRAAGKLLLMRRAPGQSNAGCWELPGGKVEPGETEPACLAREMREETGVEGTVGVFVAQSVYAYPGGEITLRAYEFAIERGEIALRVHDALCFVTPSEALAMALSPADVAIVRVLAAQMQ